MVHGVDQVRYFKPGPPLTKPKPGTEEASAQADGEPFAAMDSLEDIDIPQPPDSLFVPSLHHILPDFQGGPLLRALLAGSRVRLPSTG